MSTSNISSGQMINVQQIVSGLMAVEQRPLQVLQSRISDVNVKISAVSQLKSLVDSAYSAAKALEDPTMLASKLVSSTDESILQAVVKDSSKAIAGAVDFLPVNLAQRQRSTFAFAKIKDPTDLIDPEQFGELTIKVPVTSTLAVGLEDDQTVTIQVGGKSLLTVADEINSSFSGKLRASVVKSAESGCVLSLSGGKTGGGAVFEANWDSRTLTDGIQAGSLLLGSGANSTGFDQAAKNASAIVDGGVLVSSETNTFNDAIPGLELSVKGIPISGVNNQSRPVAISVSDSRQVFQKLLGQFATAFSNLTQKLKELTAPSSTDKQGGALSLDSGILSLSSSIYQSYSAGLTLTGGRTIKDAGRSIGSMSSPISWAKLGLQMARGGVISLDSSTYNSAMDGELNNALTGGFTSSISNVLEQFKGVSGSLQNSLGLMRDGLSSLQKSQTDQQDRLDRKRATLLAQYSALDSKLSQMSQMSRNVQSALAGLGR